MTDIKILRELARQYSELAAKPVQDERRSLWRAHNGLRKTRPLILATYGMWNVWCREVFHNDLMQCRDPFYRNYERMFRMALFHDAIGDDYIHEPWFSMPAVRKGDAEVFWGMKKGRVESGRNGGAWKFDPPIKTWDDLAGLKPITDEIDEENTLRNLSRLQEAVGDILHVSVNRGTAYAGWRADISTDLAQLRGLEQIMVDMYESPEELHRLVAYMRDTILEKQGKAEEDGRWTLESQGNQAMCYAEGTEDPQAGGGPRKRKDLWCHCAAQEFTLISPAMHDEFLLQYQLPIIREFGRVAYGCCEDLTNKIDMLRQIPNLRIIAVTPVANVARCAEQIGTDYVLSWRPNPTDMVCCGFSESRIRKIVRESLVAARGCFVHIHLKDIETVEGEPDRLARWAAIVREEAERVGE